MKRILKRLTALLVVISMTIGLCSTAVMAEDPAVDKTVAINTEVFKLTAGVLSDKNWVGEPVFKDGVLTADQSYTDITGYNGKKFKNEILQFKFKPDYTAIAPAWPAFTLRGKDAGKLAIDAKNTDSAAYMVVLKQDTFEVQAFVGGVNKFVEKIPHDKMLLESGKTYVINIGAVESVDGKGVRIILDINGKNYINYLDKDGLIKDAGYFSIYSFEAPVAISAVQGAYDGVAEFPVVNINDYLGNAANFSDESAVKDGVLTVPNEWFNDIYIKNVTFKNELLKFKFKTELTPGSWPAFCLRYQGAAEKFVGEEKGSCYIVVIKDKTIEVQKFLQGVATYLTVIPNTDILSNVESAIEVGAVDTADGVNIIMNVKGKKVVDVTDAAKSIKDAGKFVFYSIDKTATIKGFATPELLNVVNFASTIADKNWNEDATVKNGILTVPSGWFFDAYNKAKKFKNEIVQFKFKSEITPGSWPAFNLRYQGKNPSQFVGIDGGSSYLVVVKEKTIELQKFLKGSSTYLTVVSNSFIKSKVEAKIELGAVDTADGVNVIMKVNGKSVLNYFDTNNTIKEAGPLVFYAVDKIVTIKGLANTPAYKVVTINSLLANKNWNEDAVVKNGVLSVPTGWFFDAYNKSIKFKNEVIKFKFKTELAAGSWPAILLRTTSKNPGQFIGIDGGSGYMIVIKQKTIEVQKFVKGAQTVLAVYSNNSIKSKVECTLEAGAVDTADGVAIILNVNGKNVINCTDVQGSVKNSGNLVFYAVDKPVTISAITPPKAIIVKKK